MTNKIVFSACFALAVSGLAACSEDVTKPYFTFAGGGFIFNYRNSDMYYGFVLKQNRQPPEGSLLEVDFELARQGQHDIQRVTTRPGQLQYTFRTPPLEGVEKDKEYIAVVQLLANGKELDRYSKVFKTDVDTTNLPKQPLVLGPGYQPNPDLQQK